MTRAAVIAQDGVCPATMEARVLVGQLRVPNLPEAPVCIIVHARVLPCGVLLYVYIHHLHIYIIARGHIVVRPEEMRALWADADLESFWHLDPVLGTK